MGETSGNRFGNFSQPIANSVGDLIRAQLKSPNYSPGVSGWIIRRDGTAEFADTEIRGDLKVTGANGSVVWIREVANAAVVQLYPPSNPAGYEPGEIGTALLSGNRAQMELHGPYVPGVGFDEPPVIAMRGGPTGAWTRIELTGTEIGIGPFDSSEPTYPGSYTSLNTEEFYADTAIFFTHGEVRMAQSYNLGVPWVGANDGQWYESDGANRIESADLDVLPVVSTTSAAFVANPASATEGIVFRTGWNGKIDFSWGGELFAAAAIGQVLSLEVRTGGTVGSGAVIVPASDDYAVRSFGTSRYQMSKNKTIILSPYTQYNARLMYRSTTGGTAASFERRNLSARQRMY